MNGNLIAVTVVGNDRPGIVSAVTRALFEAGCNLEDATSTILRGHFAMMLVVQSPEDVDAPELEKRLAGAARELELVVTARPVEVTDADIAPPTHIVSVYGGDKPGIVFRVAEALGAAGANITDLTSRVIGSEDAPLYAVMLEVSVDSEEALEEALAGARAELGVDVTFHPLEVDLL